MLVMVAVKDLAAQTFGRPFFVPHTHAAVRSFTDEVNRPAADGQQNDLFAHPDDFELYALADFNDGSGAVVSFSAPRLLVQGKHVSTRPPGVATPILHLNGGSDAKSVGI
ncbi:MAG: nonstructural protein [Microvirus sp.]|nr:MAG: nonstructural protein [Microvirus sp.]